MSSPLRADDRLDLLELVARYAQTVDARDLDGIANCFTTDAHLEFASDAVVVNGRAAIRAFYVEAFQRPTLASGASTHVMTNTIIDADGTDEARLVTQAIAYLAPEGSGEVVARGLTYTDRCVRTPEGWRFAKRVHRLHWQATMPGGPTPN